MRAGEDERVSVPFTTPGYGLLTLTLTLTLTLNLYLPFTTPGTWASKSLRSMVG